MHVVSIAAVTAARCAIDRERYEWSSASAARDLQSVALLTREATAALDPDQSSRTVGIAAGFIETLVRLSPAAELLELGTSVPLGRYDVDDGPVVLNNRPLFPREFVVPVVVARDVIERHDHQHVARRLLEVAAGELDAALFAERGRWRYGRNRWRSPLDLRWDDDTVEVIRLSVELEGSAHMKSEVWGRLPQDLVGRNGHPRAVDLPS
jgi:hypothetical protein